MESAIVFIDVNNSQDFNPNEIGYRDDEDCINALAKMDESEYIVTEIKHEQPARELSCEIMEQLNFYDDDTEEEEKSWIIGDNKDILDSIGVTDYDMFLKTHWCAAFDFSKEVLLDKVNKARV